MGKRTRIINDPSYLVPLLRTFGSRTHKKIFDTLSNKWMTRTEIDEFMGTDSSKSLHILKKQGSLRASGEFPRQDKNPPKNTTAPIPRFRLTFSVLLKILAISLC